MTQIIACIDGSPYVDSVCHYAAWATKQLSNATVSLLHVAQPHSDMKSHQDLSGAIGLGAKSELLEELTKLDAEHGKLEQRKGQLMLSHAKEMMAGHGVRDVAMVHRRGSLVDIITEQEADASLIVIGKRGEKHHAAKAHLGSNLERVARSVHTPLLLAPMQMKEITRFLIAYDGSPVAQRAIDFLIKTPLLKDIKAHVIKVGAATTEYQEMLEHAKTRLSEAGYSVSAELISDKPVVQAVHDAIERQQSDMLVIGAYGHSKLRNLLLGSTTSALIRECDLPLLMMR
jgi:nucleotide-binding universal stress UspA family protein